MSSCAQIGTFGLISEVIHNFKHVLRQGGYLGKFCEVLTENPNFSEMEQSQNIEELFKSLVSRPSTYNDWVQLEACLILYDKYLNYTKRDIHLLEGNPPCVFASTLAKIDQVSRSSIKESEDLETYALLENALAGCQTEKVDKAYLQQLLSYLTVNQNLVTVSAKYAHYRAFELFYLRESRIRYTVEESKSEANVISLIAPEGIHTDDINALSDLDLGLGLRFASFLESSPSEPNRIGFASSLMTIAEVKRTLLVLKDVLKKDEITPRMRNFVKYTIDFAFWRYFVSSMHNLRYGEYKKEYFRAIEEFSQIFPKRFEKDGVSIDLSSVSSRIGLCQRIFFQNSRYCQGVRQEGLDFSNSFEIFCILQKHHHLSSMYQRVYQEGYRRLFVIDPNAKRKLEQYAFQKLCFDRAVCLKTPEEFAGIPKKVIEVVPLPPPEKSPKQVRKKEQKPSPSPVLSKSQASSSKLPEKPVEEVICSPAPTEKKEWKFDPRVSIWFTDPKKALEEPRFVELSEEVQAKLVTIKSMGICCLDLLTKHGVQSKWGEKELEHYSLACDVHATDSPKKYRGILTVCFNQKKEIYHYGITEMPASEIVKGYIEKKFWDVDFPPLEAKKEKMQKVENISLAGDGSFIASQPNSFTYEVMDPKNKTKIYLYLPDN